MSVLYSVLQNWLTKGQTLLAPGKITEQQGSDDLHSFSSDDNPIYGSEEYFLKELHSYRDLWSVAAQDKSIYICCPPSVSLKAKSLSRKTISSHILRPEPIDTDGAVLADGIGDTFRNLVGESVKLVGNYLILEDSQYRKRVKVMHMDKRHLLTDGPSVNIFYINRPFRGGIHAPENFDDIGSLLINRYVAALRCYPVMEDIFYKLDKYLKDLKALGELTNGDGYHRIRPCLSNALRRLWEQFTAALIKAAWAIGIHNELSTKGSSVNPTLSTESFGLNQFSDEHLGQIIETHIFKYCGSYVYMYISSIYYEESMQFFKKVDLLRNASFEEYGIKPCFAIYQEAAVDMLKSIRFAVTPVDKLLVMKQTVQLIHDTVNQHLLSETPNADSSDYEFATDDLISILLHVIIAACCACGNHNTTTMHRDHSEQLMVNLIADLHYCKDFHFAVSSKSANSFVECHFEVCVDWILAYKVLS
jgi:hypothetical protein